MDKYTKAWKEKVKRETPWKVYLWYIENRCNHNKATGYYRRGIKNYLCDEDLKTLWFRDKAWLLKKPSIHRIDNNGHYTLDNCKFIEQKENNLLGNCGKKVSVETKRRMSKAQLNRASHILSEDGLRRIREMCKRRIGTKYKKREPPTDRKKYKHEYYLKHKAILKG